MATFKEIAKRESCFNPGSTLCPGCMEGVAFKDFGQVTDNGIKTIYTMGTFCGEVSTLMWPNVIAWGRGENAPDQFSKSFGIIHNVFESAPTVAEGIRDTADALLEIGALKAPVQVVSNSGDGGAIAIGLRSLLHTIHRGPRITIIVLINELFANTGFQWSPTSTPHAESSTTPVGELLAGVSVEPIDHIGLALMAGAGYVAQVSPAFPADFVRASEAALAASRTAVIFVPSPCITGWKYHEGDTEELARCASKSGLFPCFFKAAGKKGELKHLDVAGPALVKFLSMQRRFDHLVRMGKEGPTIVPGAEGPIAEIRQWITRHVARLERLARWDVDETPAVAGPPPKPALQSPATAGRAPTAAEAGK